MVAEMSAVIRLTLALVTGAATAIAVPGRPRNSLVAARAVTALKKDTAAAMKEAAISTVRSTTAKAPRCAIRCLTAGGGRRTFLRTSYASNLPCSHGKNRTLQR